MERSQQSLSAHADQLQTTTANETDEAKQSDEGAPPDASEPLPPVVAYLASIEAREHESHPEALAQDHMAQRRRGRVEAEGFRISEEMTRRAQERLAAERKQAGMEEADSEGPTGADAQPEEA